MSNTLRPGRGAVGDLGVVVGASFSFLVGGGFLSGAAAAADAAAGFFFLAAAGAGIS